LEDEGHAVRAAENGGAALAALRAPDARLPCVILLDLMMPVMTGGHSAQSNSAIPTSRRSP